MLCLRQEREQVELLGSERDRSLVDQHLACAQVEEQPFEVQRVGRGGRELRPAQHGTNAGHQFSRRERLGDVVVGAQFEAQHSVVLLHASGEQDHRHPLGTRRTEEVEPRGTGQHDVEHDQVGLELSDGGSDEIATVQLAHLVAIASEVLSDDLADGGLIIDDEDLRGSHWRTPYGRSRRVGTTLQQSFSDVSCRPAEARAGQRLVMGT